jgi:hypothetical protein
MPEPGSDPDAGKEGIATRIDHRLADVERRMVRPVPSRSWWQRIILPMCGLVLVVAGIIGFFTPVPLFFLAVIGFPMLFCFHPRIEKRARLWMIGRLEALRARLRPWRRHFRRPDPPS